MSQYVIHHVSTFANQDKTRKGMFVQEFVKTFESRMIDDKGGISILYDCLVDLVNEANARFPKVRKWTVTMSTNQIHICPVDAPRAFDSQSVAVINFCRVSSVMNRESIESVKDDALKFMDGKKGGEL